MSETMQNILKMLKVFKNEKKLNNVGEYLANFLEEYPNTATARKVENIFTGENIKEFMSASTLIKSVTPHYCRPICGYIAKEDFEIFKNKYFINAIEALNKWKEGQTVGVVIEHEEFIFNENTVATEISIDFILKGFWYLDK